MRILMSGACLVIAASFGGAASADTGVMGAWAADPSDCVYVNDTEGVTANVTAGILTPQNVFFYGGECDVSGVYPSPDGTAFVGVCDEGDGPYDETLKTIQTGPDTMRAMWPDIGWTTFHRCWDLPKDWREKSR